MELSFFSANPQTLTLISCNPLSTSLFSARRDFLGGARHLRSPPSGLRAKRTSNKLGFLQFRSAPFRFRAALSPHSALVVGAVVTFSAISVVYFNLYRKRKKSGKEVSGLHNFSLSHLGRDFLDRVIEIWILGLGDLHKENSVKEHRSLEDTTTINGNVPENKVTPVHVNISTVMHEETHATKTEDSSGSDSHPSSANGSVFSNSTLMHKESLMTRTVDSADSNLIPSSSTLLHVNTLMTETVDSADSNMIPSNSSLVHGETLSTKTVDSIDSNVIPSSVSLVHEETHITKTVDPASSYVIISTANDSILSSSTLMHEESLITKTEDSTGSDASDFTFSNESRVTDSSFLYGTSESGALQHLTSPEEMSNLQEEGCKDESKFKHELEKLMSESNHTVLDNVLVEGTKDYKANDDDAEKIDTTSYNGFQKESIRTELHTFYEAKQPVKKSMGNINGLKSASSHVSLEGNGFSSVVRNTLMEGTKLSPQDSLPTAESVNGKTPEAYLKERSSYQVRESQKSRGYPRDNEIRDMSHSKVRRFQQSYDPDKTRVNDKDDPSKKSSTYDRLLRNGRVTECVELLEDLEKIGSLDMSKMYHARFFQACKNQKAVEEAFRFTKLISNPTLSTFNMLMSVCANSQDSNGAFRVLQLVQEAGLKADCKLYTTLISSCGRSGKVDAMFEVFHKMVNAGIEPNVHTYGTIIDGCAKAGQVAKAFGAYGIMRSKKVKPDRVVFNALITACGQSGAVDRAFDVLAEMSADENHPIDPDHVTIGALIKACAKAGQIDRGREVYKMIHKYNIKGTPEVYTIAVNCCSHTGDWEFACGVRADMKKNGIVPDEMFLSALVDAAGHAGKVEAAFEILQEARKQGINLGNISYSSLMGACCNAKNWQKALELYEYIQSIKLKPTVSTMNALITAFCDGDQLEKAMNVLSEMKRYNLRPNSISYSVLLVASEKKDDLDTGLMLFSQAKKDGIGPNFIMCRRIVGMCLRRFEKAYALGEPVWSFNSGRLQIENKWTSLALQAYRETVAAGAIPTMEVVSLVLGCLQLPCDSSLKHRMIENLGLNADPSRYHKLYSLIDGFGEYDPCALSLFEGAASQGIVPSVSFKKNPIIVDARKLEIHTAKVYLLTILKGLKHRLAAGAILPDITILLPTETRKVVSPGGEKTIKVAGRIGLAVTALLRRLALPYQGNGSSGRLKINGLSLRRWIQPKLTSPFTGKPVELISSQSQLGKGIVDQQRDIRSGYLFFE